MITLEKEGEKKHNGPKDDNACWKNVLVLLWIVLQ